MGPSVGMQWDLCAEFMGFWHYLIISGYGRGLVKSLTPHYHFYAVSRANGRNHIPLFHVYSIFHSLLLG